MRDVDLRAWRSERLEAAGVRVIVDDGDPIIVAPIDLWPDDLSNDSKVLDEILGNKSDADRYRAAGGNYATLVKLLAGTDDVGESGDSQRS